MNASASRSSVEAASFLMAKPHQGRSPKGSPHLFKAAASDTAGRFDFIVATFDPLTGPPLHIHPDQDDTWYMLDGIITMRVGDDVFDIGPGDFLSVPPGVVHTFDNLHNGGEPARAINLMTPGGHFDLFEAMAAVPAGPGQAEEVRQVAKRLGTEIVGPPLRVTLGIE